MPRPWRAAESLKRLREQVDARWPSRSKASDGSIGDAAHAARTSDHNPWIRVAGVGVVSAIDITHDPVNGPDGLVLSELLITDPRIKYLIWNHRIWKSRTGQWEPYRGVNAHTHHVHVSVRSEIEQFDSRKDWPI